MMIEYDRSDFSQSELDYITCQTSEYPKYVRWIGYIPHYTLLMAFITPIMTIILRVQSLIGARSAYMNGDVINHFSTSDEVSPILQHYMDNNVTLNDILTRDLYVSNIFIDWNIIAQAIWMIFILFIAFIVFWTYRMSSGGKERLDKIRMELHSGMAQLVDKKDD